MRVAPPSPDTDRRVVALVLDRGLATLEAVDAATSERSRREALGQSPSVLQLLCEAGALDRRVAASLLGLVREELATTRRLERRRIGRYVLEEELGRGAMGVVFAAKAPDGRRVAVKVLLAGGGPDLAERFDREKRLLWSLGEADGFVPIIEDGADEGRRFFVMPLLEGGTLRARGIVHRDLKPENVLFRPGGSSGDGGGEPLIADLGLAKHFRRDVLGASQSRSLSVTGVVAGTPGYMPREQLEDSLAAVPASDVFALGVMLYEALAGARPFGGHGLLAYAEALRGEPKSLLDLAPATPRWLDAVVRRALQHDLTARYADGGALARALERRGAGSRRRWPVAAIAFALVLLAAGTGAVAARLAKRPPAPPVASGAATPPRTEDPVAEKTRAALRACEEGRAHLARRALDEALASFDRAVALDPRLGAAWSGRARVHLERDELDRATADATRAIELAPELAEPWAARSLACEDRRRSDASLADAEQAVRLAPDDPSALCARAIVHEKRGEHDAAREDLALALARRPGDVESLAARARLHFRHEDRAAARAAVDELVRLHPEDDRAWHERAQLLGATGELADAIADVTRAIEIAPARFTLHESRGAFREHARDLEGAISDYSAAIERAGDRGELWYDRGCVRLAAKDPAGALSDLERATRLTPGRAEAWERLGVAHIELQEIDRALAAFDRALALAPDSLDALVDRGGARLAKRDGPGALADFEKAVARLPRASTLYGRGVARRMTGDKAGAIADLERALALEPSPQLEALIQRHLVELRRR